ncbi:4'-phosphopantetheinyl transferase family protein [Geodermatophilus sp. URMC 62]|uniref:4'-phosphopantetheinyl transferase family protein n=1 Tax=Geodermatophilus sp. URMC 62 TaxID=3423414 RepID=UPI00406D086A
MVLEQLLPRFVATAEAFGDDHEVQLFPSEEAVVAAAVGRRRQEFATVRSCARRALALLGAPVVPLIPGARGAPSWPPGVVGSMTHCEGYRAAAVGRAGQVCALGVDAEPHAPLPRGVLALIAREDERAWLREWAEEDGSVCWDRLLFSCKESVYKAWFPLTGLWLDFHNVGVEISPRSGTFTAKVTTPALLGLQGRWARWHGLLVTAVALPAGSAALGPSG